MRAALRWPRGAAAVLRASARRREMPCAPPPRVFPCPHPLLLPSPPTNHPKPFQSFLLTPRVAPSPPSPNSSSPILIPGVLFHPAPQCLPSVPLHPFSILHQVPCLPPQSPILIPSVPCPPLPSTTLPMLSPSVPPSQSPLSDPQVSLSSPPKLFPLQFPHSDPYSSLPLSTSVFLLVPHFDPQNPQTPSSPPILRPRVRHPQVPSV